MDKWEAVGMRKWATGRVRPQVLRAPAAPCLLVAQRDQKTQAGRVLLVDREGQEGQQAQCRPCFPVVLGGQAAQGQHPLQEGLAVLADRAGRADQRGQWVL